MQPSVPLPPGNPFGLALYDREQGGVRKARSNKASPPIGPWVLHSAPGAEEASFDKPSEFTAALRKAMTAAQDMEILFAVWEQNVETVRALNRSLKQDHLPRSGVVPQLVNRLKQCAVSLANRANGSHHREISDHREIMPDVRLPKGSGRKIDKSVLTIGEPKRIRCKEHLRFVASQRCLVCGRSPSQAHHVRYAQSRGLSLKVSDEFTVPLCAIHHNHIHTTGKEREWWQKRNIDPLKIASRLWQQSRERYPTALGVDSSKSLEDGAGRRLEGAKANDDSNPAVPATGTSDTSAGVSDKT
jgi:hypothetical protein